MPTKPPREKRDAVKRRPRRPRTFDDLITFSVTADTVTMQTLTDGEVVWSMTFETPAARLLINRIEDAIDASALMASGRAGPKHED